ncbi:hypothetical protein BUALT_Bualt01G0217200 [Buddleja alternifolia]|uniref:RNA uridylyltransferase n=1 Tax=Buddleja alternifolia TaxID=168488 RepID=A0AAV6YHJ0_9LAMI|nr:hypothetical protein BUALT_Bualt01G0217200 [Buddleja alternifolia]
MNGRGGDAPPSNGGDFLLQLLRRPPHPNPPTPSPSQPPSQTFRQDPAVAAVGPSIPTFSLPQVAYPSNGHDLPYRPWNHSPPPPFAPHHYFQQNPNPNPVINPNFTSAPGGLDYASHQFNLQPNRVAIGHDSRKLGFYEDNSKPSVAHQQQEQNLIFGSFNRDMLQRDSHQRLSQNSEGLVNDGRLNGVAVNSVEIIRNVRGKSSALRGYEQERSGSSNDNRRKQVDNGNYKAVTPPPGFSSNVKNVGNWEYEFGKRASGHNVDKGKGSFGDLVKNERLSNQFDSPGPPGGSSLQSVSAFDIEASMRELHGEDGENDEEPRYGGRSEMDVLEDQLVGSLVLEDESGEKSDKKKNRRDKDYRSDKRGQWIMGQRMRNQKRLTACRSDISRHNAQFLALFESLIPANEEKVKQKQLLTLLEKLVGKQWPESRLYLYGSCANSFGFSKSDIDVCLAMDLQDVDKSELLLKLADILQSDNLQNVQALTRARVPIVKLMDPVTGISCDICVNNVLAVENTKLLRDYAEIDVRLRQLVFIVKHWAKSRGVNQTYQGTLSSYAYVLMCIHFLQQRRPAILPCLQGMEVTYFETVGNIECSYFDRVEKLRNFGSRNGESIAQLVWAFFQYWAYCHDYANDVISVRTGSTLSKRAKDWTRRVGNDRHLICIEDPFEVSHDLGRVVDKFSIRVLREEFERAAEIMLYDPNPCVTLFEPYIPN